MVKRPDITPAQIVAIVQAVVALCVAFGLDLSPEQSRAILDVSMVIAGVLPLADAGIRAGRNIGTRV
jgi:hypothetical protein